MSHKINYFSNFVIRNSAFPLTTYLNLLENYSDQNLLELYQNPYIKEAIYIASPDLKTALDNWQNTSKEKKEDLAFSFLKYIARISSRCTPFGIFAGCDVGVISNETKIVLHPKEKFTRLTQFDMHFWIAMLQDFAKRKEVIQHLTFYPNNSIYSQGDFYRYTEYKYVKTKREHSISAIKKTELLTQLLEKATNGITVTQMLYFLTDDESENDEALEYIHQLIDFQILVSELDAQVTGDNEWERVFKILNKVPSLKKEHHLLLQCKKQFDLLDKELAPDETIYQEIKKIIDELGCTYEDKFLFQIDLNTSMSSNFIDEKIVDRTKQALCFLNGINKNQVVINQTNFSKAFSARYETKEMPLTAVLDTEIGIGYLQNSDMNDSHPLLESFSFKENANNLYSENWTANDFILEKKLQEAIKTKTNEISLSEKDFPDFNSDWENCPATFSVLIEVLKNKETEQVYIESSGGISAAKLTGRFCNVNTKIHQLTNQIIQKEQEYYYDKILAEIVHIPESRTGNILKRPVLRKYEIPYLSNSDVPTDCQITISDLMISIKNNTIVLRSKKLNKEVIPCLSNAHNYSSNGLPIYHFLADLQAQNLKPIYSFSWGILLSHYNFFPRVVYKETLLSKAKWLVINEEIKPFLQLKGKELLEQFDVWKNNRAIPKYVNWVNFDNTLLLDFENEVTIQLFLKSVKNYSKITLEEFLFDADSVVKNSENQSYTNQIILSFFKEETK